MIFHFPKYLNTNENYVVEITQNTVVAGFQNPESTGEVGQDSTDKSKRYSTRIPKTKHFFLYTRFWDQVPLIYILSPWQQTSDNMCSSDFLCECVCVFVLGLHVCTRTRGSQRLTSSVLLSQPALSVWGQVLLLDRSSLIQLDSLAALLLSTRFLSVSRMPGISNVLLEIKSGTLDGAACA